MKKIAISQSNYIPWKGYFDLIASVDEFILYDDMQFTRQDWRNRNLIKTPHGLQWLTVPVQVKGRFRQTIRETAIDGADWAANHWRALLQNYRRARHFSDIAAWLEPLYLETTHSHLSTLNRAMMEAVCGFLGIATKISHSWDYHLIAGKTERLVDLCLQAGATEYISGPAAQDYIDVSLFADQGIGLTWCDYSGYPPYSQQWGPFDHGVTVLDLLFNCGKDAGAYMKSISR